MTKYIYVFFNKSVFIIYLFISLNVVYPYYIERLTGGATTTNLSSSHLLLLRYSCCLGTAAIYIFKKKHLKMLRKRFRVALKCTETRKSQLIHLHIE